MATTDDQVSELATTTETGIVEDGQQATQTETKQVNELAIHFQSLADKRHEELRKLTPEAEFAKKIKANPELLALVEQKLNSSTVDEVKRPVAPQLPDDYDEVDSFTDPKSSSAKYRKANEKYIIDLNNYTASLIERQQKENQQRTAQSLQEQQFQQQVRETEVYVMSKHGLSRDSASDFMEWSKNPDNYNIDTLLELYKLQTKKPISKAKEILDKGSSGNAPLPVGAQAAQQQKVDPNDYFNNSLVAQYGKK